MCEHFIKKTNLRKLVLREMENYTINLLGVREARWTGTGKQKLTSGHAILLSRKPDNEHSGGVAIIFNRKDEESFLNGNL